MSHERFAAKQQNSPTRPQHIPWSPPDSARRGITMDPFGRICDEKVRHLASTQPPPLPPPTTDQKRQQVAREPNSKTNSNRHFKGFAGSCGPVLFCSSRSHGRPTPPRRLPLLPCPPLFARSNHRDDVGNERGHSSFRLSRRLSRLLAHREQWNRHEC